MSLNDNSAPSGGEAGEPLGSGRPPRPAEIKFGATREEDGYRFWSWRWVKESQSWAPRWMSPGLFDRQLAFNVEKARIWREKNRAKHRAYVKSYKEHHPGWVKAQDLKRKEQRAIGPSVYICVEEDNEDAVKIGVTGSMTRLRHLQNGNFRRLSFAYLREFSDEASAYNAERYLHDMFKARRLASEWFQVSVSEAIDQLQAIETNHIPPEALL